MSLPPQISGILGMGYSSVPNPLDNAALQDQIASPVFSLQIRSFTEESVLYFNMIPEDILEETSFVKNIGEHTWQIDINNLKVGQQDFSYFVSASMIIDSTINMIYFNRRLYDRLLNRYFKACTGNLCPCHDDYPDLLFILEGVQVTVRSINYISIRKEGCYLLLGRTLYEDSPILAGIPFLKDYIVTFDK